MEATLYLLQIASNFLTVAGKFIISLWWIIIPVFLFRFFQHLWLDYMRDKHLAGINWVTLEVRISKAEDLSPKIAENIFSGLHGTQTTPNVTDTYLKGDLPPFFSLEIVGIDGNVHFFIRAPRNFKNLVEANIYAQYPEAEVDEVEDYTDLVPQDVPNASHNLWGAELVLVREDAYPIKTYPNFKDITSEKFIDPLASLTEVMSGLQSGEQIWIQIIIRPVMKKEWQEAGENLIKKLTGRPLPEKKAGVVSEIIKKELIEYPRYFAQAPFKTPEPLPSKEKEKKDKVSPLLALTMGEQEVVKAIENNISKVGFDTKIRFVYVGRREVFSKARVAAVIGTFKQFSSQNLNGFKPSALTKTSIDYFFKKTRMQYRQRRILARYRQRNMSAEKKLLIYKEPPTFVFNTEELATIFHFPMIDVKTPMLRRVESKKGVAPGNLPIS